MTLATPRPTSLRALAAAGLLVLASCGGTGNGTADSPGADAPADAGAAAGTAMMDHLGRQVGTLGEKMVGLARAIPEERWDWRPMEGVRTPRDVFNHVAADNYFVAALMGVEVPAETEVTTDGATVGAYEERMRSASAEEAVAALEDSFRYMDMALAAHRDDPGAELDLRGNAITAGDLWVRAVTHLHEHLGQSIAYARANEVVPPWSQ